MLCYLNKTELVLELLNHKVFSFYFFDWIFYVICINFKQKDLEPIMSIPHSIYVIIYKLFTEGKYEDCVKLTEKYGILMDTSNSRFVYVLDILMASLNKIVNFKSKN